MSASPAELDRSTHAVRMPIVFYDGDCGLCSRFVQVLLRLDRHGRLFLAPLQGETARAMLPPLPADERDWSMVFLDENGCHLRSEAVLRICRRLGGLVGCLAWLRILPRGLRDAIYGFVARRRRRWFARPIACAVPSREVRQRLLP